MASDLFRGFNLHIPAGQRVGLVGRSGSGKTTLTTLLLRLADLSDGSIQIDGQDIAHVSQVSLRQHIAYVPQEPLLFHRTVRENIAYGRPDASEEEIMQAAREANALEFIEKLPRGLDTQVGERGVKLSGGQRQRIAIARALIVKPQLIVLDEPTSSLDKTVQAQILNLLKALQLKHQLAYIFISHDLGVVRALCHQVMVLRQGVVVEQGECQSVFSAPRHEYTRQLLALS